MYNLLRITYITHNIKQEKKNPIPNHVESIENINCTCKKERRGGFTRGKKKRAKDKRSKVSLRIKGFVVAKFIVKMQQ
jgi:hypothetical protein